MVFSSNIFIFYFIPIFLGCYFLLTRKNLGLKNLVFLLFSLLFYFWSEQEQIYILLVSIVSNYLFGIALGKSKNLFYKKVFLTLGLAFNLSLLAGFKYYYFLIENLGLITLPYDYKFVFPDFHIFQGSLPLGISFFTFQGLSYLIDIYRKDSDYEPNFINMAIYISMFPQLVAGPIVRYKEISSSIISRSHSLDKFSFGATLFTIGLGYKVLIANILAVPSDTIFDLPIEQLSTLLAWIGISCYTLQIYFDFCGYSTMAIGLGLMLGFKFPNNFNFPYISQSITEFWRRWHITLSQWFKDYLYIPLGGNRENKYKTYRNLLIVFLLCGVWHGASWTFIIWGLYHGFFLVLERIWLKRVLQKSLKIIRHIYTLFVIVFGWVIFKADTLDHTFAYIKALLGFGAQNNIIFPSQVISNQVIIVFLVGLLLSTPIVNLIFFNKMGSLPLTEHHKMDKPKMPFLWFSSMIIIFLLSTASLASGTYNPFIYFRF